MKGQRDTMLRAEIVGEVTRAMREVMEQMNERYVSGDELGQTFSFFSRSWLRYYGHLLPRERVCVVMEDGESRTTAWGYPLHKIQRMVSEGAFRVLEYKAAMKDLRTSERKQPGAVDVERDGCGGGTTTRERKGVRK